MSDISDLNKTLTIKYFTDVLTNQNYALMPEMLSPDYSFDGVPTSIADNQAWAEGLHKTYPGLVFTVEAILAEDDMVALRWRLDAPASGDRPAGWMTGTNIITSKDGLALSNWQNGTTSPSWKPAA